MWVQPLGLEDLLEKEMATHSRILAWKIHRQRSLAGYNPWSCKELDTTERACTWAAFAKTYEGHMMFEGTAKGRLIYPFL